MPSDAIDFLFDWQEEDHEAARMFDDTEETLNTRKWGDGTPRKPWPPREITEEELANEPTRKCKKCGVVYPQTDEFFRHRPARTRRRGKYIERSRPAISSECRNCSRAYGRKHREGQPRHTLIRRVWVIRHGAKARGHEWGFDDREDLRKFYDTPCHYCGGEVEQRLALDRIDNAKGYIPGNVVQCCWTCNRAKATHSVDEWVAHMQRVVNHLRGQNPPDETS
jgi:hypothetical protein